MTVALIQEREARIDKALGALRRSVEDATVRNTSHNKVSYLPLLARVVMLEAFAGSGRSAHAFMQPKECVVSKDYDDSVYFQLAGTVSACCVLYCEGR